MINRKEMEEITYFKYIRPTQKNTVQTKDTIIISISNATSSMVILAKNWTRLTSP